MAGRCLIVITMTTLVGCGITNKRLPNPIADYRANAVREICKNSPAPNLPDAVKSEGFLFPKDNFVDPERQLLVRRLSFLELYDNSGDFNSSETKRKGVIRYQFAEITAPECAAFVGEMAANRSKLSYFRSLGLPNTVCIIKQEQVEPKSQYVYYRRFARSTSPLGEDWTLDDILGDLKQDKIVAQVSEFGYCDSPACWHGFACRRDKERERLHSIGVGIPDPRVPAPPKFVLVPDQPFQSERTATLRLVAIRPSTVALDSELLGFGPNTQTTADGTIYVASTQSRPENVKIQVHGTMIVNAKGDPMRARLIRTPETQSYGSVSLINESEGEISFLASSGKFGKLQGKFFRYSLSLQPLEVVTLDYADFPIDQNEDFVYYYLDATSRRGKLELTVLGTFRDSPYKAARHVAVYVFSE